MGSGNGKLIRRGRRFPAGALLASATLGIALFAFFAALVPRQEKPWSAAVRDREGQLLGAAVASDGQWRFPPGEAIPDRFIEALLAFEDKRFYLHPGVDPLALARALAQDVRAGKVVSGGSTITMQAIRLMSGNPPRTVGEKIREAFLALILEARYAKRDILSLYAANAPYGGNVVGLEAASWRYFNRPPASITWAEAATLAVLPNQPSLVHPGGDRARLKDKRDRLLARLHAAGKLDADDYRLSLAEPLPDKPWPLPRLSPHYLERLRADSGRTKPTRKTGEAERFSAGGIDGELIGGRTTLDRSLQTRVTGILERWSARLSESGIKNAGALVIDTRSGDILAYVGNTGLAREDGNAADVDMVRARRSSGSLLKPFLYGAMLDAGLLLPRQLVPDIPTRIGSYKPENNLPTYQGVVRADQALSRSLNVPAVRELRDYGIAPFLEFLKKSGFTTFTRSADEYGLPLILGGGECTMEETARAYAAIMNRAAGISANSSAFPQSPLSRGAAWLTLEALVAGTRPEDESMWESWASARRIAWKTGTSYGNRDAWAIGTTPGFTVAVWAGNATGEGRPELKSATTAAPILFEIFSRLPQTGWPETPEIELERVTVCAKSGHLAGPNCDDVEIAQKPIDAPKGLPCPWCRPVSYTPDRRYRATANDLAAAWPGSLPLVENEFVLPPVFEWWYVRHAVDYRKLPPWIPGHEGDSAASDLMIAFPDAGASVFIPVELDGTPGSVILQAVSRERSDTLYWDLDGEYLGETRDYHEMAARPGTGVHRLTVTDSGGRSATRSFTVLSEN